MWSKWLKIDENWRVSLKLSIQEQECFSSEWQYSKCFSMQYAGTVMTSFDHIMIPTRGNWFQTNPLEHEFDDSAGNRVTSVYVTNGKDTALQGQIWPTFVTVLWFCKTKIQDGQDIGSCESLVSYDFQNLLTILALSSNIHLKAVPIFIPLK